MPINASELLAVYRLQAQVAQKGLDLVKVLPKSLRNVQTMAAAVRERDLIHLFPLLRLENELQALTLTSSAQVAQETTTLMQCYPSEADFWDCMGHALLVKAAQGDWPTSLAVLVVSTGGSC
jgi:hypothetical protein